MLHSSFSSFRSLFSFQFSVQDYAPGLGLEVRVIARCIFHINHAFSFQCVYLQLI